MKKEKNTLCFIALAGAFKDLRKYAEKGDSYWTDRYYENINGMVRIMWYTGQS